MATLFGTKAGRGALKAGAHVYLNFLSLTRNDGWIQGRKSKESANVSEAIDARQYLINSAKRYSHYQEMRKTQPDLVPSADMAVVWAADLKRPTSQTLAHTNAAHEHRHPEFYAHAQKMLLRDGTFQPGEVKDPIAAAETTLNWGGWYVLAGALAGGAIAGPGVPIGATLGLGYALAPTSKKPISLRPVTSTRGVLTTPAIAAFDTNRDGIVSVDERAAALAPWEASRSDSAKAWARQTWTPYERSKWSSLAAPLLGAAGGRDASALADAVASQASFVSRMLRLGPRVVDDAYIDNAISGTASSSRWPRRTRRRCSCPPSMST